MGGAALSASPIFCKKSPMSGNNYIIEIEEIRTMKKYDLSKIMKKSMRTG